MLKNRLQILAVLVLVFQSTIAVAEEKPPSVIKLQSTFTADKEQPAISYFIPWKGMQTPNNLQWNIERKNDDTLSVVDREIMLRSLTIYNEMRLEYAQ